MKNVVLNWSSGKDASFAYYLLKNDSKYNILSLLTSVSAQYNRVSMHGTRIEILEKQAELIGIALEKIFIPENADMETYDKTMQKALQKFIQRDIKTFAFGDIFLEDLRKYREVQLAKINAEAIFPLWKKDTKSLVEAVEDAGIVAKIICVNDKYLGKEFLGRIINKQLLNDLLDNVDPCGENGEYHTLVIDAPFFKEKMQVSEGEIVYKKYPSEKESWNSGFYYLDMILEK
jgi:uncharacterized protein (TIGR00290 family)